MSFFWWCFGGASYVSALPLAKRLKWKTHVLRGDSAKDLGWLVTSTKTDDLGYPVKFPNGKKSAVVLRIHETPDSVMKNLNSDEKRSLKKAHDYILQSRKNKKGKYVIGKPLWTPSSDFNIDSGEGKNNEEDTLKVADL